MSDLKKLESIIEQFDKNGLRFLFLFKLLKSEFEKELIAEEKDIDNSIIDDVCGEAAKELLINSEQTPSKEEITEILSRYKEKLEEISQ
jgi:hypothetical protein